MDHEEPLLYLNMRESPKKVAREVFKVDQKSSCRQLHNNMKNFFLQAVIAASLINFSQSRNLDIVGGVQSEIENSTTRPRTFATERWNEERALSAIRQ